MNRYVKIINTDNQVVDAIAIVHFVKWSNTSNMVVSCPDYDTGVMGILASDTSTIWHIFGKDEFPPERNYITTTYVEIDKAEYDALREALDNREDETEPIDDLPTPDEPVDPVYDNTLEFLRASKISEMSRYCNTVITNGIDVELSDGQSYHFSLTTQDQLNLLTLSTLIAGGQQQIPYHADDELCKFYDAVDMLAIIQKATEFKSFQVTYFNALKAYIESLDSIEEIGAVEYGMDIPEEFQSDVLKALLENI